VLSNIRLISNIEHCASLDSSLSDIKALILLSSSQSDAVRALAADSTLVMEYDLRKESLGQVNAEEKISVFCSRLAEFCGSAEFEMRRVDLVVAGGDLAEEVVSFLREKAGIDTVAATERPAHPLRAALEAEWCCEA
jgi:hypothetical protein